MNSFKLLNPFSSYDAIFDGETLGIELFAYGAKKNVVRVSNTHPIGVPYIGDQVCLLTLVLPKFDPSVHSEYSD